MTNIPTELRALVESGPLTHLTTINPNGSPQVTVIWIGLDGEEIVSGHMHHHRKLHNIERDPRVVLSFVGPRNHDAFLNPYAVIRAHATVEPSVAAWDLLNRLAKMYMRPHSEFPAPKGPGYITHYRADRISGVGPWVVRSR